MKCNALLYLPWLTNHPQMREPPLNDRFQGIARAEKKSVRKSLTVQGARSYMSGPARRGAEPSAVCSLTWWAWEEGMRGRRRGSAGLLERVSFWWRVDLFRVRAWDGFDGALDWTSVWSGAQ